MTDPPDPKKQAEERLAAFKAEEMHFLEGMTHLELPLPRTVYNPNVVTVDTYDGKERVLVPGPSSIGTDYHRVATSDMTDHVLASIPEGIFYTRGDVVGTIDGDPGQKKWHATSNARMRLIVDDHVRLQKRIEKPKGTVSVDVPCNEDHARLVLEAARRHGSVRELDTLTHCPLWRPGWTMTPPGFEAGIFYDEPPSLAGFEPHRDDELLDELIVDFPFKDLASKANLIGLLVTCLIRPAIDGNVPMHLVMSSLERSGKTKLVEEIVGGIILGKPTPAMQLGDSEEERDKRILSKLMAGATVLHVDNLRHFVDSACLSSLITSSTYSGRMLGVSHTPELKNNLILVATGNNVRATGEICKRTVPIVFQPTTDAPELRDDIIHEPLRPYVASVRKRVLEALCWRIQNWVENREPSRHRLGGFESWASAVGGIVGGHWMDNAQAWQSASDPETEELRAFVSLWWQTYSSAPVRAKQLIEIADACDAFGYQMSLPGSERARLVRFGVIVLSRHRDRPVDRWIIRRSGAGGSALWRLQEAEEETEEVESGP